MILIMILEVRGCMKAKIGNKIQSFGSTVKLFRYMFGRVWQYADGKHYVVTKTLVSALNALVPLAYTILPGLIINELTDGTGLRTVAVYVAVTAALPLILSVINAFGDTYMYKLSLNISLSFQEEFQRFSAAMDYDTIENPDIQVQRDRAQSTIESTLGMVDKPIRFVTSVIKMLAVSSAIFVLNPLIVLLIVVMIYINSLIAKKINAAAHAIGTELSDYDRKLFAPTYMFDSYEYAKEVRMFGLISMLVDNYRSVKKEANVLEVKQYKANRMPSLSGAVVNFIQQLVVYAYTIFNVLRRGMAIGTMTIYLGMTAQFSDSLKAVFNTYISMTSDNFRIQELINFFKIPSRQRESGNNLPKFDKASVIEFKNVSFKYPGSDIYAIKNLNLKIGGNEKLCIVGINGAGKSTFIKLLTRLYMADEGEILLNGVNINEYDYEAYLRLFAPVFQDFVRYYFTLGRNITLTAPLDKEKLDKICDDCGLTELVGKLPKGYDTQVGKFVDDEGIEPSGGEDQRIAIARACYQGGYIYVLDEPTASIDPMAENEIYTQFHRMIQDHCAILITHRLSAVKLADNIAVFDGGSIAEYGTHAELYAKGGIYTEMFDRQAEFYRDNPAAKEADE